MAEYSWHFGGPVGAIPEYNQEDDAKIFRLIFSNGVFSGLLNELEVIENDPVSLSVRVKSGWAFVYGRFYNNTSLLTKTLAAADPDNDRIDRIILRLDTTENFKISIEVLTGTPAGSPTPPTLTQTASIYEISLAQVLVLANATSVNNAKITDERTYAAISNAPVTLTNAETLTNKRITRREVTIASSATPTPNSDITDIYTITAVAQNIAIGAPTGTPTQGQTLLIRIKDNGTARALSFNAIYRAGDIALPTTTILSKTMYLGFIYNATNTKWDLIAFVDNI